jgi:hypothetical protein
VLAVGLGARRLRISEEGECGGRVLSDRIPGLHRQGRGLCESGSALGRRGEASPAPSLITTITTPAASRSGWSRGNGYAGAGYANAQMAEALCAAWEDPAGCSRRSSTPILEPKIPKRRGHRANMVAMDRPGCAIQIRGCLDKQGSALRVRHTAELLAGQCGLTANSPVRIPIRLGDASSEVVPSGRGNAAAGPNYREPKHTRCRSNVDSRGSRRIPGQAQRDDAP